MFKVGDKVRARESLGGPEGLTMGKAYEIIDICSKYIYVLSNAKERGGWYPERFELIPEETEATKGPYAPGTLVYYDRLYQDPLPAQRVTGEVISYHELPWGNFVWCSWDQGPALGERNVDYVTIVQPEEAPVTPVFNIGDTVVITDEAAFANAYNLSEYKGLQGSTFEITGGPDAHGDYVLSHPEYPDIFVAEGDLGHVY